MIALADAAGAPLATVGAKARALARAAERGFAVPAGVVLAPHDAVALESVRAALGEGPYAVRSSSPSEDSAERSWAGQLESRLPVAADGLLDAVAAVRGSAATVRACAYGAAGDAIPVLIQPVVAARCGGVAFSLDPLNGDPSHCVVEAVEGLPIAVTDGAGTPFSWRLPVEGGPPAGPADARVPARALREVGTLVLEVAAWLGVPCDVEWAWDGERTWLLQSRPITAASWRPLPGQWSSANLRDTMPGIVTPLASSIILEADLVAAIDDALRLMRLARRGERVARVERIYAHAYWRVDELKERLVELPGFVERSFDEAVGIVPAYDGDGRRSALTPSTLLRAARAAPAVVVAYRREAAAAAAEAAAVARAEAGWLSLRWDGLPAPELERRFRALRALHAETGRRAYRVTALAEQAQDVLRQLLARVGRSLESPLDDRLLLSGSGPPATAAASAALQDLARRYAADARAIAAAAHVDELPPAVGADLRALVDRYGWMADGFDELSIPRWEDDLGAPLALFKAAVRAGPVAAADAGGALERERAAEELRALAAAGAARPLVRVALSAARSYQAAREDLRVATARLNRVLRRALVAHGRRLAASGLLDAPEAVFWLTATELERTWRGELDADAVARAIGPRRREAARFRNWDAPVAIGEVAGDGDRDAAATRAARTLTGIACSSGRARGRVAVVRRIEDLDAVEPGSVLVVKHANPGWAPAFVLANALVVEEGGLLSHSSVIARERGLPAVISVARATQALRDGDDVEVDGRHGIVTVLAERES